MCPDALWLNPSATSVLWSFTFSVQCLTEPVERLVEAQHLVLLPVDDKIERLANIHLLNQLFVQEHILHVHVLD
jgi:hypothetical protein